MLIGGSPCQGFSFAGKQLNFNDPRSALFFEFVRILKECKPKYFLMENVRMKKEYQDKIINAFVFVSGYFSFCILFQIDIYSWPDNSFYLQRYTDT